MAQGANTIVLLIHQGGYLTPYYDRSCKGLNGAILLILDKLDPAISLVVSGHTHNAYICNIPEKGGGTQLLTSAGKYGTLLTEIRLQFSRRSHRLVGRRAGFHIVQGEGFATASGNYPLTKAARVDPADPRIAAIVKRYADAARPIADRVIADLPKPVSAKSDDNKEKPLGDLIADAQLAWARSHGGAQIAFMNGGGVRTDLTPRTDGSITFGQLFALQPFGNGLVVQTLTGAQLKRLLEQQFVGPELMEPSAGFAFAYDEVPAGGRSYRLRDAGRKADRSICFLPHRHQQLHGQRRRQLYGAAGGYRPPRRRHRYRRAGGLSGGGPVDSDGRADQDARHLARTQVPRRGLSHHAPNQLKNIGPPNCGRISWTS